MQAPGRARKSVAELADVMEAVAARDGKAARKAGSLHVRNAAKVAIEVLRQANDAALEESSTAS
jgi:DNA-binding GntR family transcriptional regulator